MEPKNGEPPSPVELLVTSLLLVLERRLPAVADDLVMTMETEALLSELRRLHSNAPNPDLVANLHRGKEMAVRARYVVLGQAQANELAEPRRKRRKGRG